MACCETLSCIQMRINWVYSTSILNCISQLANQVKTIGSNTLDAMVAKFDGEHTRYSTQASFRPPGAQHQP